MDMCASRCDEDANDDDDKMTHMASAMVARRRRRQRQGDERVTASVTTRIDARGCDADGTRQRDGDD